MTHPISFHDQIVAYIQSDAYTTVVDNSISYEIIANMFEVFWRAVIAQELSLNLVAIAHEESHEIPEPMKRKILLSVWSINDGLK
jgi:hypothetical protein